MDLLKKYKKIFNDLALIGLAIGLIVGFLLYKCHNNLIITIITFILLSIDVLLFAYALYIYIVKIRKLEKENK